MKPFNIVIAGLALLVGSTPVFGQPTDNTGDRQRYVVNSAAELVVVESPVNNEAQIVFRNGTQEFDVIGFGDTVPGIANCANIPNGDGCDDPGVWGPVTGIGHPDMNDSGVIVSSVVLTSENLDSSPGNEDLYNDNAIVTGVPGNLTTVARTLQTIGGLTVCNIEPLPQINASGQVFFGTTIETETIGSDPGDPLCLEDGGSFRTGSGDLEYPQAKALYRYTPGSGTQLLLHANMNQSLADEVTTSDPRWVGSETTFKIIDAHLIAHSHGSVTDGGDAMAFVWVTDDSTVNNANCSSNDVGCTARRGLVYLDGSSIDLIALEQARVADSANNLDRYAMVDKGVSNNAGRVVFKAEDYGRWSDDFVFGDTNGIASLNNWTPGGGLSTSAIAKTGDAVPGAAAGTTFNGFPPLQAVDDFGQVAFTAGLEIPGFCDAANAPDSDRFAEFCRGIYHTDAGGTITELARTTAAAQAAGAGASAWTDGSETFAFDSLGPVAVLGGTPNTVYFVAFDAFALDSNDDPVDPLTLEPRGVERNPHNSDAGIFVWQNGSIEKVVAEGDVIPLSDVWEEQIVLNRAPSLWQRVAGVLGIESAHAQGGTATVIRLFTPMPQLRQHAGPSGFAVRAWLDTTGDGEADVDSMLSTVAARPALEIIPVPTMSTYMFVVLGMILMVAGFFVLRGRAA